MFDLNYKCCFQIVVVWQWVQNVQILLHSEVQSIKI